MRCGLRALLELMILFPTEFPRDWPQGALVALRGGALLDVAKAARVAPRHSALKESSGRAWAPCSVKVDLHSSAVCD